MAELFAYTDGACSGNPGPGGWGVLMRAMDGDLPQFDHCLNAMLLLAYVALRQGDQVGVQAFGGTRRWMPPVKGAHSMSVLLNHLFDYRTSPEPSDFTEAAEQLMARYMGYMFPALLARASHPAFMGNAVYPSMDIVGIEGAENWDMGALMRYRSRRSFMEIVANPVFMGEHKFKVAALDKTIAFPIEPRLYLGDPRLLLGLVLLALTAVIDSILLGRRLNKQ